MRKQGLSLLIVGGLLLGWLGIGRLMTANNDSTQRPVQRRSTSTLALSNDGRWLLTVNPDSDTLSILDTTDLSVPVELPVGDNPRTVALDDIGNRAYVANQDGNSISVIDLGTWEVVDTIPLYYQPYGVVMTPDGQHLYVSAQGSDEVVIVETAAFTVTRRIPVADRPRALAVSADGNTLYVTHLLGNQITVLSPLQRLTMLPVAVYGGHTTAPEQKTKPAPPWTPSLKPASGLPAAIPLFPDSNLVSALVLDPNGRFAYVPHTRSNSDNATLTFDTTVFPLVSQLDLLSGTHLVGQQFALGVLDPPGVGLPVAAAVSADGLQLWIVNAASNDVTVIDLLSGRRQAHLEVGDYPQGIVLSPDGSRAYVHNALAGTISVVETNTFAVTDEVPITSSPLPPLLWRGKQLFLSSDDPRMSEDQWIACNICHFEGDIDGRTWHFGFAGPRNTTGLHGMIATYPLRWSGEWDESADAEFVIRQENFGSGLLISDPYCQINPPDCVHQPPNQGRAYDLDALAAYMDSLAIPLSSHHAWGQPLTPLEELGQALFLDSQLECASCHPPPLYTDLLTHDVGTATSDERIGSAYDTPTLWGVNDSSPYFHDGSATTLTEALMRSTPGGEHDVSDQLSAGELQALVAFLQALPYEE